jgi:hypothetical protein
MQGSSALLALAISLVAAGPASAQLISAPVTPEPATPDLIDRAEDSGAIDLERASLYRVYALSGDPRLPAAYESNRPWRGTQLGQQLQRDLPKLDSGPERRAVTDALRAPPDPNFTTCSTSAAPLAESRETEHFYIQFPGDAGVGGGLAIEDYAASLEESYAVQVAQYDWAAPPQTAAAANAIPGKYHVRVEPLELGLYGFVSSGGTYAGTPPGGDNPDTPWAEGDARGTCMVLNSDFETGFPGTAQQALDATTAHEYNHSIQFGYGALDSREPDLSFSEGGATWMEDEAHDDADDNYNYLYPAFTRSMGEHPVDTNSEYAYWLTFRGLIERFGANTPGGSEEVMQDFWEIISRNEAEMLDALRIALVGKGRTLAETYHDYAVAAKFMRPCGASGFLPYCFEEAAGYTAAAGGTPASQGAATTASPFNGSVEDDYTLNWVDLPSTGFYNVILDNTSSGGELRATVACSTASGVAIAPFPAVVGSGQTQTLPGFNSASCSGATPVIAITNQLQRAGNPSSSAERSYRVSLTAAPSGSTNAVVPAPVAEEAPDNSAYVPPPGGTSTGGTNAGVPTSARDLTRPVLTRISLSSRRFRAARSGAAVRLAAPLGTRIRYRLNEAASVTLRYERKTTGRRVGGRCRAATRRNRKRAKCTRWVRVRGTARHRGRAGTNAFRLTGRMRGRALRLGVYRLLLSARDGAGNASATRRSASFRIVRR